MKKLLFIILLFPLIGLSQTQTITSVNALKAKQWIDAPLFKISGTSIDTSTSTIRWFTKHKMDMLTSAYNKQASQWTTSSSDIYFNSGNVYIGKTSGTYKLDVNGAIGGSNFETNTTSRSLRAGSGAGNSENESTQRYNVYLGYASGYTNSTGDQNVYIGSYSGYSSGGKTQSVLIGYNSGYNLTGGNNTFIGSNSGYTATNTNSSILIGNYAGYYLNKSNSFIVNSLSRSTATEDTTYSILYGVQNASPLYQRLRINGYVGIGLSPSYKLDVDGDINISSGHNFKINGVNFTGSSQWTTSGSDIYYNSGNVGIGTNNLTSGFNVDTSTLFEVNQFHSFSIYDNYNDGGIVTIDPLNKTLILDDSDYGYKIGIGIYTTPNATLDVNGSINGTSYYLNGASLTPKLYYQKSIDTLDNLPYSNAYIKLVVQDTVTKKLYRTRSTRFQTALTNPVTGTGTANYLTKFTGTSTVGNSLIRDDGTNVGVGIAPATYKFRVEGSAYISTTFSTGSSITSGANILSGVSSYIATNSLTSRQVTSTNIDIFPQDKDAPYIRFGAGNDNTTFTTEWARFVLGGSFGIGTTSPVASAKVEIVSTTQGLLPPRMTTTQREAILTPAEGLLVYDLTLHKLYCYDGSTWQACW